jgi:hypothetical protein
MSEKKEDSTPGKSNPCTQHTSDRSLDISILALPTSAVARCTVDYKADFERFVLHKKNYVQQYNLIYHARLNEMRSVLRYALFVPAHKHIN